jgi:hypothetical protein
MTSRSIARDPWYWFFKTGLRISMVDMLYTRQNPRDDGTAISLESLTGSDKHPPDREKANLDQVADFK